MSHDSKYAPSVRMKVKHLAIAIFLAVVPALTDAQQIRSIYDQENLVAWCIVPYDKMNRTPSERAAMLKELGITKLAYDWRDRHLPSFAEEIETLKQNNIRLKAVWFWVNGNNNEYLDDTNHFILQTLRENKVGTELWLSFNNRFFDGLSDEQKLDKAVRAVGHIREKAREIGCSVHLYNHGSWFGEPENQVKIIKALGVTDIGIVYNFHHARHQVDQFPTLLEVMKPYLSTVNINGMKKDGPMIVPVGQGDDELSMLKTLESSGFRGSIGILCHVEDEDAKVVLKRNIDGLRRLTNHK